MRVYGAVLALLAVAACSSPYAGDAAPGADVGGRTTSPVEGCGSSSWTDPRDRSPNRAPARCRPGAPPARPPAERRSLTIATGTLSAEYVAPLQVDLDKGGGVDSAWLLDPVWRRVDGTPGYAFLGGQPRGEPLGGMLYGRVLLQEDVDAGVALLRAYIRTLNSYFASDYKADETFVTYLAKLLKTDKEVLSSTPPLRMDWEIRAGTTARLQSAAKARARRRVQRFPSRRR